MVISRSGGKSYDTSGKKGFSADQMLRNIPFQDVAKAGLKFGDEDLDPEEEKAQKLELEERYKPLVAWLKKEAGNTVMDGGSTHVSVRCRDLTYSAHSYPLRPPRH